MAVLPIPSIPGRPPPPPPPPPLTHAPTLRLATLPRQHTTQQYSDTETASIPLHSRDVLRGSKSVTLKDLGPQFSYKGVFLVEYAAPLIVYAAFYHGREWIYPAIFSNT